MIIKINKSNNFSVVYNEIYRNPNISARAKGIYGYIMTLPPDWKLILTNLYDQFAEGRDAIRKALAELEENGYIIKERVQNKAGKFTGWDITVLESLNLLTENPKLLNIYTNSKIKSKEKEISNSTIAPELKKEIRTLFSTLYESKTEEISGNKGKLPWSGKEASLLKLDLETHGADALKKYIYIFFSDQDKNIADFTRHRNAAGYSFGVFHGMLGKLALSKVKIKSACEHCGGVGKHSPDCKIILDKKAKENKEREEIDRLREENKDFSLTDAFNAKIGRQI